jgi:hypothetical protein
MKISFYWKCVNYIPKLCLVCHILPPSLNISIPSIQTQEITELVKDIYTPHFTLSTNSPPTHQLLYFCPYL